MSQNWYAIVTVTGSAPPYSCSLAYYYYSNGTYPAPVDSNNSLKAIPGDKVTFSVTNTTNLSGSCDLVFIAMTTSQPSQTANRGSIFSGQNLQYMEQGKTQDWTLTVGGTTSQRNLTGQFSLVVLLPGANGTPDQVAALDDPSVIVNPG